jgi:hypothetical protein
MKRIRLDQERRAMEVINFERAFSSRDVFEIVVGSLNWSDVASFYKAVPQVFEPYTYSTMYSKKLSKWHQKESHFNLKPVALTFKHYMLLWHYRIHCLDLGDHFDRPHPNFDLPLDGFHSIYCKPEGPKKYFMDCKFFPPEAPYPFSNGLIFSLKSFGLEFYQLSKDGYWRIGDIIIGCTIVSIVISPGGRLILCLDENHFIYVVVVKLLAVTFIKTGIKNQTWILNGMFKDERTFVTFDNNWDFWLISIDEENNFSKTLLYTPEMTAPIIYLPNWGKVWDSRQGTYYEAMGFLYSPGGKNEISFLVIGDNCDNGKHGCRHYLQIVTQPEKDCNQSYFVSTDNCVITDYLLDWTRKKMFVIVLTTLSQQQFRIFTPIAIKNKLLNCKIKLEKERLQNLGVYELDFSDLNGNEEELEFKAKFYMPTKTTMLELYKPRLKWPTADDFGKRFSFHDRGKITGFCNRIFLAIRHNSYNVLLFPLAMDYKGSPFSISVARHHSIYASTAENEFMAFLPGTGSSYESIMAPRISRFCPHNSNLFQIEEETSNDDEAIGFLIEELKTSFS